MCVWIWLGDLASLSADTLWDIYDDIYWWHCSSEISKSWYFQKILKIRKFRNPTVWSDACMHSNFAPWTNTTIFASRKQRVSVTMPWRKTNKKNIEVEYVNSNYTICCVWNRFRSPKQHSHFTGYDQINSTRESID